MKAILMSIQSKWLAKILNGEKTVEIRKTMPKCELPIDVYLYCTKGKERLVNLIDDSFYCGVSTRLNGKVVAKFTLNKVEEVVDNGGSYRINNDFAHTNKVARNSCLDFNDMKTYLKGKNGYAWHISNLEIFDKPKELNEFYYYKKRLIDCSMDCPPYFDEVKTQVRKAPQSWQYVEVE